MIQKGNTDLDGSDDNFNNKMLNWNMIPSRSIDITK